MGGRRVAVEELALRKRSGRAAKHKAAQRLGGTLSGAAGGAGHGRGHWARRGGAGRRRPRPTGVCSPRPAVAGARPRRPCWSPPTRHATPRHATPTPPLARVTLPLPPPLGRPGAASARKTLWGSVRLRAGGLRGPVQLQPPEAKPSASPAASAGSLGDVDGALQELPLVQPCLRNDPQSIASHFLACSSQATHALLPPL